MRQGARAAVVGLIVCALPATGTSLGLARTLPPPQRVPSVAFAVTHERPVAGQTFTGLAIILDDPNTTTINRVLCDAQVGAKMKILRARLQAMFTDASGSAPVGEILCTWRIPAHSVGQRLRLRDNGDGPRAIVYVNDGQSRLLSPELSWRVRRSSR
jgi:hypothetical protein